MFDLDVEIIAEAHCRTGIKVWQQHGSLVPKLWTSSVDQRLTAEPIGPDGLDITLASLVVLLTRLAQIGKADMIGRTGEAWMRSLEPGDEIPEHGDLGRVADFDPAVRTSIVTEALDLRTGEMVAFAAGLDLDENGAPTWTVEPAGLIGSSFAQALYAARSLVLQGWRADDDLSTMENFVEDCDWHYQISAV